MDSSLASSRRSSSDSNASDRDSDTSTDEPGPPQTQRESAVSPRPSSGLGAFDTYSLTQRCELLKDLSGTVLTAVMAGLRLLVVAPDEFLGSSGDDVLDKAVYWVVKGVVAVASHDGECVYSELSEGMYFGLAPELGPSHSSSTLGIMARTKTILLSLTADLFRQALDLDTAFSGVPGHVRDFLYTVRATQTVITASRLDMRRPAPSRRLTHAIRTHPMCSGFSPDCVWRLALTSELVRFPRSWTIVRNEADSLSIYIVVSGTVALVEGTTSDSSPVSILGPGAAFGVQGYLGQILSARRSFVAESDCECLVIPYSVMNVLCDEYPTVRAYIEGEDEVEAHKSEQTVAQSTVRMADKPDDNFSSEVGFAAFSPTNFTNDSSTNLSRRSSLDSLHVRKRLRRSSGRLMSLFNVGVVPDAIQIKIFHYLALPDLMRMQLVCNHWRDLVLESPTLVSELNLKPYNRRIDDQSIVPLVDFAGARCTTVDMSNCFHLTDQGFTYLVNGLGLSTLRVFKMASAWSVSSAAILSLAVPSIGASLEELDLSNCRTVTDDTVIQLVGDTSLGLLGCPNLRKLNLSYCKHVTDRTMRHLANHACDRLEELVLMRCTGITDQGFACWSMRPFAKLRRLDLSDCAFLTDRAIIAVAGTAKDLTHLSLSFCCGLTDISVQVLAFGCRRLESLNMAYCGSAVSDHTLNIIALQLRHLQQLSVRGCARVSRAGTDAVVLGCRELHMFDRSQCNL